MEIKIGLYKSEIVKAAKDETYLSGRANIAADGSNSEAVYHMQAGGEEVHEEKLMRSLRAGLEQLKAELSKYVKNDGASTGDNIVDTLTEVDDYFDIVMNVSKRFNKAYTDVLEGLSSAYLSSYVIASWWMAVTPALAKNYFDQASLQMDRMRQCFVKEAPKEPSYKYPTKIELKNELEADFYQLLVGNELTIYYTVSGDVNDVKDDIVVESSNINIYKVEKRDKWYVIKLSDSNEGYVVVYSKHNPDVCVRLG